MEQIYNVGDLVRSGPQTPLFGFNQPVAYSMGEFTEGVVVGREPNGTLQLAFTSYRYNPDAPIFGCGGIRWGLSDCHVEPIPGDEAVNRRRIGTLLVERGYLPVLEQRRVLVDLL